MRVLVVLLLVAPALAGCLGSDPTQPPVTDIGPGAGNPGNGNGGDGGNGDGGNGGDGGGAEPFNVTLTGDPAEGGAVTLTFENGGDATLGPTLAVTLTDPLGRVIDEHEQALSLTPGGSVSLTWPFPEKLLDGDHTFNATIGDEAVSTTVTVAGTAREGEEPLPVGTQPTVGLQPATDAFTYHVGEGVEVTITNKGNRRATGDAVVSFHAAEGGSADDPANAPLVEAFDLVLDLPPGDNLTLDPFVVPAGFLPSDARGEYYVVVQWSRLDQPVFLNFFVDNRTFKSNPSGATLERTWQEGPTFDWDGNLTIALPDGAGGTHPYGLYVHYATSQDVSDGHAGDSVVPTPTYLSWVADAFNVSWAYYLDQGWLLPQMPIHVYLDHPGGQALGTMREAPYGAHVIIGSESLHDSKDNDVNSTVAHELFHVFQTRYDLDEGFIVEGFATWIMDQPFGTTDYLGNSRAFLNAPDDKPVQYREHELGLFMHWLNATYGTDAMKSLVEASADYDNEHVFQPAFGASFDELWTAFVEAILEENLTDADVLFHTTGVFGLRAWEWYYKGETGSETLSDEAAGRHLKLPIADFEARQPEMTDEDVGQVKHAYGFDVYDLRPDNGKEGTSVTVTFQSLDAGTDFLVLLAERDAGTGAWTAIEVTGPVTVTLKDDNDSDLRLLVTRLDAGTGRYDIVMETATA